MGAKQTLSGVDVTPEKAMSVPAINRGVHLMSDMVGMLPLALYRRLNQGKEKAKDHRQYDFLHRKPNSYMNAYQFRYLMQRHMILRGNAYAFKNKVRGYTSELIPIHPKRVSPEQDDNFQLRYEVQLPSGIKQTYGPERIWHLRPRTEDGITGLGIVDEAPNSIAMCVAAEEHGAMLFGNGAVPGGLLSFPNSLTKEQMDRIKESWQESYGGKNKFKTAVLDNGGKWESTSMDNEKAQYLEVRSFQVAEAARLLGIPPILLFHSDTTSTFASAKELVQAFLKFSLDPWLTFWEMSYNQDILSQEQGKYFVEFIRQSIEQMDLASMMSAYSQMIESTIASPNEIRDLLNWNAREGGDEYGNPNTTSGNKTAGDGGDGDA